MLPLNTLSRVNSQPFSLFTKLPPNLSFFFGPMGEMKFQQPEFTILVNDRKNSQRKGNVTGEKQEFINLWTSLLPFV
jgi:hypothetical protein